MALPCICANDLNRYVVVQQKTGTLDAGGQLDESAATWVQVAKEWCQIASRGSREFLLGSQVREDISHTITMRYSPRAADYTTEMRVKYGDRYFNFAGPPQNLNEKDRWLVIPATEVPVL